MATRLSIAGLMLLGFAVRSVAIDQPLVTFHATRHYRSAVLARACYTDHAPGIPEWARTVAAAAREMQPAGELPLMEWVACGAYLALGAEMSIVPRLLAVLAWVAGSLPLWWLARRIASPAAAFVAVALYLFLPYAIVGTRNFQPDPLMTLASLCALVAIVRHHDAPTPSRFAAAAVLIGAAGVIKPMSVFLTLPPVFALSPLTMDALRRAGTLALLGLAPAAAYYGYGALFGTLAQDQMRLRFVPAMLATRFYWESLAQQIGRALTLPLFVAGIAGAVMTPSSAARRLLWSLFAGYAAFAVAFTYHMATHDYYHLPYIAVMTLGVAALLAHFMLSFRMVAAACAFIAIAGTVTAWPRLWVSDAAAIVASYEEIGRLAAHDTKVLFLDSHYGYALMYHGQISGDAWPNVDDLAAEAVAGMPAVDADARYERDYAAFAPHYFVITDLGSLRAAPDLQAMLARRASPVALTDRYHVYRLRGASLQP